VLDEMMKRDGKKSSHVVSPYFLKLVEYLLYEIPEDVMKTPRVVGRLMSILKRSSTRALLMIM